MAQPDVPSITIFNIETETEEAVSPAVPDPPSPRRSLEQEETVVVDAVDIPVASTASYETSTTTATTTAEVSTAIPTPTASPPRSVSTSKRTSLDPLEPITIVDFYRGRSVLLTGATGFVGKAVLWKLLDALGNDVEKIYVLIRNGSNKRKMGRPKDRLKNEILSNKVRGVPAWDVSRFKIAFMTLRRRLGMAQFDALINEKVVPVACDLIAPGLGISPDDRAMLVAHVNIVIHCAATMDFNERLDLSLEINTLGTLRLMDLADECHQMGKQSSPFRKPIFVLERHINASTDTHRP
ncbi:male sterility protein-domain-containing protein [Jimgerdemannia flammicorona]|uniref:Fatty acyl-CoA reductase n=1 Tax=Jimgerdemannia flammicorona TaxID=994334 RepID=A0A433QGF0_9FUNG|nr:male sterility protein-domain-containing protein [Jimgerdemannia flammicorona]